MTLPHLLSVWPELRERVADAPGLLLALDFDGTLSPIALRPDLSVLPPETKEVLGRLAAVPRVEVAVVSGRGTEDLTSRVGLDDIAYAANHGLEIRRSSSLWKHPVADKAEGLMVKIEEALRPVVAEVPGALLEPKGMTLSVHYRRVKSPERVRHLRMLFQETVKQWLDSGEARLTTGKLVMELRPAVSWGKGHALAVLLGHTASELGPASFDAQGAYTGSTDGRLPLYLGDDSTDEDAFRAIVHLGIPVKIGTPDRSTAARYWLRSPDEVQRFLEQLAEHMIGLARTHRGA